MPSTFTVMNLNDSGAGSLRAAVAAANMAAPGPNEIDFAAGLHGTITLTSGELLISNSVTINGPGANKLSVSGNNASRVFEINGALLDPTIDVTISGLTITHGYAPDDGGGIKNDVANLTTLLSNPSLTPAGANLTLSGDNLTQNVAYESSTTVPTDELAVTAPTGNPVAGPAGVGGGLESLAGTLTITGCQITGNQALGSAGFGEALGGGIAILGGSRTTIKSSTFSGNLARGGDNCTDGRSNGGGLGTWVPVSITDCTISDNVAHGGDNAPNSVAYGGGISFQPSSSGNIISSSTFSGNQAVAGNGGTGLAVGEAAGGAIDNIGTFSVSGSTFDHNQALGGSGGNSGLGDPFSEMDYAYGGAICSETAIEPAVTDITTSTFSHNQAVGGNNSTATGTDLVDNGGAEGGALCNEDGATMTVSHSTLDHNQAIGGNGNTASSQQIQVGEGLGGAIASGWGGTAVGGPNTLTVSNCTLTQNSATGGDNNHGTATVTGLIGAGVGAGIANYLGGMASVSDSDLDHNQASGGQDNTAGGGGAVVPGLGAGAGIFNWLGNYISPVFGVLDASVVTVSDCLIDQNQAQAGGGGSALGGGIANLYSYTTTVSGVTTTVSNSILSQNQANGGSGAGLGGGAYNDASCTLTLTASLVTQNEADGTPGEGGGVYDLGIFSHPGSLIIFNHASTSGDNVGP